jgi:serralysin
VIEGQGATSLVEVGTKFFLDSIVTGTGPSLKYAGADVVAGQFSNWTPIGAEQTATGYQVVWKMPGSDQYSIWTTDSSGNFISTTQPMSGATSIIETAETAFHQDFNGDGVIGVPGTVIEAQGSTSLVEVGTKFFLDSISTGTGPSLKYAGADVIAGQFGGWTPIATEQTTSGYEVAWKLAGVDEYSIWSTDSSGNTISNNVIGLVTGNNSALESIETSFHQDLNGDGVIGVPGTVIEAQGVTSLVQVGTNFFLDSTSSASAGPGPAIKYSGSDVFTGEFGTWTPIGAEQTATGYQVAWKIPGADQ